MRTPATIPTAEPLPYGRGDAPGSTEAAVPFVVRDEAVARFDALLHEINPDAVRADPVRVARLVQWLLALPVDAAQEVLDSRLRRIDELRRMLADEDWDSAAPLRARLEKLLAYVDRDDDLIEDHQPLVGLLDDVLLLELSWPMFADEAGEYLDFSAWRSEEHPTGSGDERRHAWIRDRLAEIELLRHRARIDGSRYASSGAPASFRIR